MNLTVSNSTLHCNDYDNVLNLCGMVLSTHELSLLSKRLTFIPKPKSINKTELYQDVQTFVRNKAAIPNV